MERVSEVRRSNQIQVKKMMKTIKMKGECEMKREKKGKVEWNRRRLVEEEKHGMQQKHSVK